MLRLFSTRPSIRFPQSLSLRHHTVASRSSPPSGDGRRNVFIPREDTETPQMTNTTRRRRVLLPRLAMRNTIGACGTNVWQPLKMERRQRHHPERPIQISGSGGGRLKNRANTLPEKQNTPCRISAVRERDIQSDRQDLRSARSHRNTWELLEALDTRRPGHRPIRSDIPKVSDLCWRPCK